MRQRNHRVKGFIALAFLLIYGQASFAQKLFQIVSVDIKEQRLEDALATISKKADFYFSYSSNYIPKDSIVSVSVENNTVKEVLDLLLSEKYEYKEAYNYIILRPAPYRLKVIPEEVSDNDSWYTVTGFVVDERTGGRVFQASVYEKRLLTSTLTDRQGYFKLKLSKKENEIALTVSKELYRDVTFIILPSTFIHPGENKDDYNPEGDPQKVERTALGRLLISSRQKIQSLNLSGFFTNSPFQASLTPGLGSHGLFNSQVINKFSLNIAGGYTFGVKGLELAGGFNINKGDVSYFQAAGGFNVVGGSVLGVQLAGVNNTIFDSVKGLEVAGVYNDVRGDFVGVQIGGSVNINKKGMKYVQIAGAMNLVRESAEGAQIAGAVNIVRDSITGAQIAGGFNEIQGSMTGVQVSGAYNHIGKKMDGLQISGGINVVSKEATGVQLTGLGNISNAEINGVQIAGLFNYARKLKGLQVGLINIADSSSGVSIGLLNFIKESYHKVSLSYNDVLNTNLSFKSGNAKLYSVISGGMNISEREKAYSLGLGIGHDFILNKTFLLSVEANSSAIYAGTWNQLDQLYRAETAVSLRLVNGISIFAGPAFNFYIDNNIDSIEGYKNIDAPENLSMHFTESLKGWIGFEAGITFF